MFPTGASALSSGIKVRLGRGPAAMLVVIALAFVVMGALPSVFQMLDSSQPYRGIRILPTDADVFQGTQVREVSDGYPSLGSPVLNIGKNEPALRPAFPMQLVGTVARLFRIDALIVLFAAQAFVVFLLVIALGLFMHSVTNRAWLSVLSAGIALFGAALLSAPWDVVRFLHPADSRFLFLRFTVDFGAQWAFLWLIVFLGCVSEWLQRNRRKWLFGAAIAFLMLVMSSDVGVSFAFTTLAVISVFVLWRHDLKRTADVAGFWMIVLLLSTPQLMHLYVLSRHVAYAESMERLGLVSGHDPLLFGAWLGLFLMIGFTSKRLWPRTWPLLPAMALAAAISLNFHVLTGSVFLPHRAHSLVVEPIGSLLVVAVVIGILHQVLKRRVTRSIVTGLTFVIILIVAGIQQWGAYREASLLWGRLQQAAPAIKYVAQNLRPGQTVYSQDTDLLAVIPAYTSADVTINSNAGAGLVTRDRLREAFFFQLWLEGLQPDKATDVFSGAKRIELSETLYGLHYRESAGDSAAIPDAVVQKEADAYRAYTRLPLREKLSRTPVTAIITTPHDITNPVWTEFLRCAKSAHSGGGYDVYLMKPVTDPGSCLR